MVKRRKKIDSRFRGNDRKKAKLESLRDKLTKLTRELEDREWASRKTNEGIKILYKELEDKSNKLKKLDQIKSQFVINVAHEFKTPLTIARECIDLMLEGHGGEVSPVQKEFLARGLKTLDRLIRLVTDLLDLAKIESGKMVMKRVEVDMPELVNEILATYEAEAAKKGLSLEKHIEESAGMIWADRDKISEVVINLLTNAIKYTPAGGSITVSLQGDQKKIRCDVRNSGPGIPKKFLRKIFDKFERVTAEKQEGTGLGLPIAKDIVSLHKGRLWVESEAGKGSVFIFTLPRSIRNKIKKERS